jgi:glycosyltransferase involved in cell wall biosynthesis
MISLVIPLLNEAESIPVLFSEIDQVAKAHGLALETIFVDDGSHDESWAQIVKLSQEDSRVRGIRLRRNFGKAAALMAGVREASGDPIVTLDADLQDDPREIPALLERLNQGFDVISGWKRSRHDPWARVFASRVFNRLVSAITGVRLHDHNCGLKAYRAALFAEVQIYGELHRFIPVLAASRGFRVGELEVNHRPRRFGHSKYGSLRFQRGFLDLLTVKFLTGYSHRPQHLLGGIGLLCFMAGLAGMVYLALTWLVRLWRPEAFIPLHERPLLLYSVAGLVLGAQMMSLGLIAELITSARQDADFYSIAEQTAGPATPGTSSDSPS